MMEYKKIAKVSKHENDKEVLKEILKERHMSLEETL